jgi:hypothetical protein
MADTTDEIAEEMSFQPLEDDCKLLGSLLDDCLRHEVGEDFMARIEKVRSLAHVSCDSAVLPPPSILMAEWKKWKFVEGHCGGRKKKHHGCYRLVFLTNSQPKGHLPLVSLLSCTHFRCILVPAKSPLLYPFLPHSSVAKAA